MELEISEKWWGLSVENRKESTKDEYIYQVGLKDPAKAGIEVSTFIVRNGTNGLSFTQQVRMEKRCVWFGLGWILAWRVGYEMEHCYDFWTALVEDRSGSGEWVGVYQSKFPMPFMNDERCLGKLMRMATRMRKKTQSDGLISEVGRVLGWGTTEQASKQQWGNENAKATMLRTEVK